MPDVQLEAALAFITASRAMVDDAGRLADPDQWDFTPAADPLHAEVMRAAFLVLCGDEDVAQRAVDEGGNLHAYIGTQTAYAILRSFGGIVLAAIAEGAEAVGVSEDDMWSRTVARVLGRDEQLKEQQA